MRALTPRARSAIEYIEEPLRVCVTLQNTAPAPRLGPIQGSAPEQGLTPHQVLQNLHTMYAELTGTGARGKVEPGWEREGGSGEELVSGSGVGPGSGPGAGVGIGVGEGAGSGEWDLPVALDETLVDLELALVSSLSPSAVSSPSPCPCAVSAKGCFADVGCSFAVVKPSMQGLAYLAKYLHRQDTCIIHNYCDLDNHANHDDDRHQNRPNHLHSDNDNDNDNSNGNDNHGHFRGHDSLPVTLSCTFESGQLILPSSEVPNLK